MLSMAVNGRQDDWDLHLTLVEIAYNNSVSAATGLAPNRSTWQTPTAPPDSFRPRSGVVGHQSLARDHLVYCDLATDRKIAGTTMSAHAAPSPFLVLTANTPPSPTRCVQHLPLLRVVGLGCTILPLPSASV